MSRAGSRGLDQIGPSRSQHRRNNPLPILVTNKHRYRGLPKNIREAKLEEHRAWAAGHGIQHSEPDDTTQFIRAHQHSGSRKHTPSMPTFKFTEPKED